MLEMTRHFGVTFIWQENNMSLNEKITEIVNAKL